MLVIGKSWAAMAIYIYYKGCLLMLFEVPRCLCWSPGDLHEMNNICGSQKWRRTRHVQVGRSKTWCFPRQLCEVWKKVQMSVLRVDKFSRLWLWIYTNTHARIIDILYVIYFISLQYMALRCTTFITSYYIALRHSTLFLIVLHCSVPFDIKIWHFIFFYVIIR